ncbi:MAG: hypothetical protein IEMM0008_0603 [bacterium]|nr:MAG: hypothetical protein IEMM0008_0603 [bacterium]
MSIECPKCGHTTLSMWKCPKCGDTRCASGTCKGDNGKIGRGGANVTCHSCKAAKYEKAE